MNCGGASGNLVTLWLLVGVLGSLAPCEALIHDDFISSNDTIKLRLSMSAATTRVLSGPPGSKVNYEFILHNHLDDGVFSIKQSSDDGFLGEIRDDARAFFLKHGSQRVIRVSNLVVPYRKEGEKVRFTLIAEKHQGGINSGLEGGINFGPALREGGAIGGAESRGNGQGGAGIYTGQGSGGSGTFSGQGSGGAGIYTGQGSGGSGTYSGQGTGSGGIYTGQGTGGSGASGQGSGGAGIYTGQGSGGSGTYSGQGSGSGGIYTGQGTGGSGTYTGQGSGSGGIYTGQGSGGSGSYTGQGSGSGGIYTGQGTGGSGASGQGSGGAGIYTGQGSGGSGSYNGQGSGTGGIYTGQGTGGSGSYTGQGSGTGGIYTGQGTGGSGSYTGQGSGTGGIYTGQGTGGSGSYTGQGSGTGGIYTGQGTGGIYTGGPIHLGPGHRSSVPATIEFTVTSDPIRDTGKPWVKFQHGSTSASESCPVAPGNPGCENHYWLARFYAQDELSGIQMVTVLPFGKEPAYQPVYYRHVNFPIGSTLEHEVIAVASCCLQGMSLRAVDVAGNDITITGIWDDVAQGLSKPAIYGIIGGVVAFVLIIVIIVVVVIVVQKKKASN